MTILYFILMMGIILMYLIINGSVRQRYLEELEPLDEKQYTFKGLLPFGLWFYDELKVPSGGSYSVFLYQRIVMVYGTRYARYYLKVHWAEKVMYFCLGMAVASFLGAVSGSSAGFLPVVPIAGGLLFFLADKNLDDKAKKRKLQLMMDFPVFISKLTLLMNAGMHLRQALERIYADVMEKTPFYAELGTVLEVFSALDWLARLITHIPNKGEQMVKYYGYYSNKSRGMRKKDEEIQKPNECNECNDISEIDAEINKLMFSNMKRKKFNKSWAKLIHKVYNVDPLKCSQCGGNMSKS